MNDVADIIIFILLIGLLLLFSMGVSSAVCASRWAKSGMETSWGPIQGCQVQRKDGTWVPSDTFRETGDSK